ncbi:PREDICTED: uncharacterized protein LOC108547037 [Eufriesea mexicana]|uniref:uncharacterized protein LOC108547037 n=1 Tax=Eufriesea mexicana TaxID=516756 RepID=UPI00083C027A|nr:PREDICTED: uncharacterized protein LOC108547037 [Eufriesea mexicana]
MRIFVRGRHAVYALLCVCVHCTIAQTDDVHQADWKTHESEAIEKRPDFRAVSDDDFSPETSFQKKLIPIKEPRVEKNFRMLTLPLEPDAEMLPAHYTGVKPPGVDHMELKYAESQVSHTVPKSEPLIKTTQVADTRQVAKKHETKAGSGETGQQKASSYEAGQKGDRLKKKKKTKYVESGAKKGAHGNQENSGYRNVYHKDEYKKNHDFYDNDDHGGHSKKHGRYNEKHVAIEGTFKRGGASDANFGEAEHHKQGISGNSRINGESKGQEIRRGYDGFLQNFQGFAKQTGRDNGKRFGFGQIKVR